MQTVSRIFLSIVSLTLLLFPVWALVLFWHVLSPAGFWEKFAILTVGAVFVGSFQFFLLVLWIIILSAIWG